MEDGDIMIGTKGIEYYQNYSIPINYYENIEDLYSTNNSHCYRLLFIEDGIGSIRINHDKIAILPLSCLCLNENDKVNDLDVHGIKSHLLCFLPSAINNKLTLENINSDVGLTISDSQDKQFILPFISQNKSFVKIKPIDIDTGLRLKDIFIKLKELIFIQNDSWPCLTRSYLIELLFLVERTFTLYKEKIENINSKQRFSADDVLHYIHNNYWNRITINDLVKEFNTNRTTLSKEFKNATGISIVNYILKTRIEIAAGMLRDTHLNVAIIIERVGFNNVTHFNKVFKEHMKCLPNEYRKQFSSY